MAFYATWWGERVLCQLDTWYTNRGVYGQNLYARPLRRAVCRLVRG